MRTILSLRAQIYSSLRWKLKLSWVSCTLFIHQESEGKWVPTFKGKTWPCSWYQKYRWTSWFCHPEGSYKHLGTCPWRIWSMWSDHSFQVHQCNNTHWSWTLYTGCCIHRGPSTHWGIAHWCQRSTGCRGSRWSPWGCWSHRQGRCRCSRGYWAGLERIQRGCLGENRSPGIRGGHCSHQFRICHAHWRRRCMRFGPRCEHWWCRGWRWLSRTGRSQVSVHHRGRRLPRRCRCICWGCRRWLHGWR